MRNASLVIASFNPVDDAARNDDQADVVAHYVERRVEIDSAHVEFVCTSLVRQRGIGTMVLPMADGKTMPLADSLWESLYESCDELATTLYMLLRHSSCEYVSEFRKVMAERHIARHIRKVAAS